VIQEAARTRWGFAREIADIGYEDALQVNLLFTILKELGLMKE